MDNIDKKLGATKWARYTLTAVDAGEIEHRMRSMHLALRDAFGAMQAERPDMVASELKILRNAWRSLCGECLLLEAMNK